MVKEIFTKVLVKILFGFVFFYLLFVALTILPGNFKIHRYIHTIENLSRSERYGDLKDLDIAYSELKLEIFRNDLKLYFREPELAIKQLKSNSLQAYLVSVRDYSEYKKKIEGITLIGKNVVLRGYGFLVLESSGYYLSDITRNSFTSFLIWLKEFFANNNEWGLDERGVKSIRAEIMRALPFTISLLGLSLFLLLLMSLSISFILTGSFPQCVKKFFSQLLELISTLPEFVLCFLLIIFIFRPLNLLSVFFEAFLVFPTKISELLPLLILLLLPSFAVALSNDNTCTLVKYLVNRISTIKNSQYYIFLQSNNLNKVYLNYIIVSKELIPLVSRFIAMKIPLIFGTSIVIERIFDIKGISNLAFSNFRTVDNGYILAIFFIIYLITVTSDIIADLIMLISDPKLRRL